MTWLSFSDDVTTVEIHREFAEFEIDSNEFVRPAANDQQRRSSSFFDLPIHRREQYAVFGGCIDAI
jgi:hypothetical protein